MSKYDGIKVVDVKSENIIHERKKTEQSGDGSFLSGFIMRALAGALIIGALFSVKLINHPIAEKAVDSVKSAVTYDLNKREEDELGNIKFIELLKEFFTQKEQA